MDLSKVPSYKAGIAQSRAHRALGIIASHWLKDKGITMLQWFILGLVYEAGEKGIRITDIAQELDTTKAFVTKHINTLEANHLVTRNVGKEDSRSRIVRLTKEARPKVIEIEQELRAGMRLSIYKEIKPEELAVYVKVLSQLSTLVEK